MLTGKAAFGGPTVADCVARTLGGEPDWEALPEGLSPHVKRLLRHCLVKDLKHRLHDIADARLELQDGSLEEAVNTVVEEPAPRVSYPLWALAVLVPLAVVAGWMLRPEAAPPALPTVRFEVPVPEGERLMHFMRHGLALSPDGGRLAFMSGEDIGDLFGPISIKVRDLSRAESLPLAGAENVGQPVFSPDGEWLAVSSGPGGPPQLRKIPVDGGTPQTICECDASYGATWESGGSIVFAGSAGGLQRVSAAGGAPVPITRVDTEVGEYSHRLPHSLPGGDVVLFTALVGHKDWKRSTIEAYDTVARERTLLIEGGTDGRYVPPGFLVFAREGKLLAARFDAERLEVLGPAVPVVDGVNHSIHTWNTWSRTGVANYAVSPTGTLVYLAGSVFPESPRQPVLMDGQGGVEAIDVDPQQFVSARLSEDGEQLLLGKHYPPDDAWLLDLNRGSLSRQTFAGGHNWAIWGPGPDELTSNALLGRRLVELRERYRLGTRRAPERSGHRRRAALRQLLVARRNTLGLGGPG